MTEPEPPPSRDEQVTVAEAAGMVRVSKRTLYRRIADGTIDAVTGPGRIRLHMRTVRALAPRRPE